MALPTGQTNRAEDPGIMYFRCEELISPKWARHPSDPFACSVLMQAYYKYNHVVARVVTQGECIKQKVNIGKTFVIPVISAIR